MHQYCPLTAEPVKSQRGCVRDRKLLTAKWEKLTSKKQCLPPTMELVQDGASSGSGSGYGFPFLTKNYNQYPLTKEKLAISNWIPLIALTTLKVGTKLSSGWATWKEQNFCRLCLILLCLATFVLIFFSLFLLLILSFYGLLLLCVLFLLFF